MGDNGDGGGFPTTARESQYARVHLYVYRTFRNIIIKDYLIIFVQITGNKLVIEEY